jgi:hypothetical protein
MVILSEFNNFYNGGNPLKAKRKSDRKIRADSKGGTFFLYFDMVVKEELPTNYTD